MGRKGENRVGSYLSNGSALSTFEHIVTSRGGTSPLNFFIFYMVASQGKFPGSATGGKFIFRTGSEGVCKLLISIPHN